jgi:hypothetical protein
LWPDNNVSEKHASALKTEAPKRQCPPAKPHDTTTKVDKEQISLETREGCLLKMGHALNLDLDNTT